MFTRYTILRLAGPEVFYIDTLLIKNEFVEKTAKSTSLHKRCVLPTVSKLFHHCFKPKRIYCVLNSKYIFYVNASIQMGCLLEVKIY